MSAALLENAAFTREASDFGGIAHYNGEDYPCSIGPMTSGADLTGGGFSLSKSMVIVIRKSAFGTDPTFKPGQTVTVTDMRDTNRTLKIAKDGINDLIYLWQLTLVDPAQSA
jgi:hypothetical protein